MTKQKMLTKVIERAVERGWDSIFHKYFTVDNLLDWVDSEDEQYGTFMNAFSVESILFSHDFAKAYWGEEEVERLDYVNLDCPNECRVMVKLKMWEYRLQQCVLSDDPINYYYSN